MTWTTGQKPVVTKPLEPFGDLTPIKRGSSGYAWFLCKCGETQIFKVERLRQAVKSPKRTLPIACDGCVKRFRNERAEQKRKLKNNGQSTR